MVGRYFFSPKIKLIKTIFFCTEIRLTLERVDHLGRALRVFISFPIVQVVCNRNSIRNKNILVKNLLSSLGCQNQ